MKAYIDKLIKDKTRGVCLPSAEIVRDIVGNKYQGNDFFDACEYLANKYGIFI